MSKNKTPLPVSLAFATSMYGPIKPAQIKRIEKFLKNPTFDTWDDISTIIIIGSGRMKTVWNAVIESDPCFPRGGRVTDRAGNVVREWAYIPSPKELVKALQAVLLKPVVDNLN